MPNKTKLQEAKHLQKENLQQKRKHLERERLQTQDGQRHVFFLKKGVESQKLPIMGKLQNRALSKKQVSPNHG